MRLYQHKPNKIWAAQVTAITPLNRLEDAGYYCHIRYRVDVEGGKSFNIGNDYIHLHTGIAVGGYLAGKAGDEEWSSYFRSEAELNAEYDPVKE